MIKRWINPKLILGLFSGLCLALSGIAGARPAAQAVPVGPSRNVSFDTVEGDLRWDNGVSVNKGRAVFQLAVQEDAHPRKLKWAWRGAGQVWAMAEYTDKNVIYYIMKGSEPPKADKVTFIDQNGVPRIMVPTVLELPQGTVLVDLLEDYRRYYGQKEVGVENVRIGLNAADFTEIKDFMIEEYAKQPNPGRGNGAGLPTGIHLQLQVPQGNDKDFYLIKGVESPIQVMVRAFLDKSQKGELTVTLPETVTIISYDDAKLKLVEGHTLLMPLAMGPGYAEESFAVTVKGSGPGRVVAQARLGDETQRVDKDMACPELESISGSIRLRKEGVYPVQHSSHKVTLKKELKNYVKVKEDVFSSFHKLFGAEEEYDKPAGMACGVLENGTSYNLLLRVKLSVLDANWQEIPCFRGEHFQREGGTEAPPVPETVISVEAASAQDFKVPLFADAYSVKPGIYPAVLKVSLFGTSTDVVVREFDLHVEKESQIQIITGFLAIVLSLLSVLLMVLKNKSWAGRLKTSEIILIALFAAVKFSIVDVPWFVFGDVIRAVLGPMGPFMHLVTGVFWDIINAMFLVSLVVLISKPGVVIISSAVRIILQGIAFGTFNPVTILLMLSYAFLADALLYFTGFTSQKRAFQERLSTFSVLGVIFAMQHVYSTYTFYYIWMYLYRLFYPNWYINISAIVSAAYSALGAVMGVYLGNRLKRVNG
ncbi:MAG: hypothetical protein QHH10_06465 [Peptococcaceae bacterium]|nr:hypothetical protein [Peptococcaceae bacterium]MDH7524941.1 hypothetical protein [Peptococcaceae bacterium]